jgi:hypothetical protein
VVACIHRFGSSLNKHVHFHVCVVDGVFEEVAGSGIFHPASGIDANTVAQAQTNLRRRNLRAFVGRGLLGSFEAKKMLAYPHSGFCARPPFAMERLRKAGSELVCRCAKQYSEPTSDKRGAKADELTLTPLELIDRTVTLVPPPRTHRHRYFRVPAPNSPLRAAVTATTKDVPAPSTAAQAESPTPDPAPPKHAAHYLWAVLIARNYEVTKCFRSCAHCVVGRCASSRSLRTAPWHMGQLCRMTLTRRWERVLAASQVG